MDPKPFSALPISLLDLATVGEGRSPAETFQNSLRLARMAERWGFRRFWLAEHHNMESVASSATVVLIGFIAGGTSTIRVGSGGIMLPNHAPLIVAEQFGTLESLYPGRIDLGLGRAPGTDPVTSMALRRERLAAGYDFPQNIEELRTYLSAENRTGRVRAIPGEGLDIPIWILGSSTESAWLAGSLGLPYAFASHFAPAQLHAALNLYRQHFTPSDHLKEPYMMACVNVVAADTDEEATRLSTSFLQLAVGLVRGRTAPLPPPVESMEGRWTEWEEAAVRAFRTYTFVGAHDRIRKDLQEFVDHTGVDELMVASHIYDPAARLRSYEILHELWQERKG
ncbi:LLM class flavin-dependent oxidoreductase [Paraflavisolibacter sp. H34]|uniref:LLM class flavin-dependent oxidoreductase n=1 Tax=Huijunlia imazamoxiresistens TaxID=3127457 RepID=UPI0030176C8B